MKSESTAKLEPIPPLPQATCSARRALELCESWTLTDMRYDQNAPFLANLEHRLACIREGLTDLDRSPNAKLSHRPERP